uniref:Uncharacterized protein n=1 Tax=Anguilla anguilla TaxID=7936 RepID=A0A0E9UNX7_ANGAN
MMIFNFTPKKRQRQFIIFKHWGVMGRERDGESKREKANLFVFCFFFSFFFFLIMTKLQNKNIIIKGCPEL